ncbi:T9SS type A sorting domain-containing protein [Neolewinella persica]|uniref:T9SS type A sorting domain-containing protein n=1 Tax=Neolewinella persica TaxID=70998 RepID=UPI00039C0525|nr:T9SS type A sorting domain-containing protein [Neolewinella persica]
MKVHLLLLLMALSICSFAQRSALRVEPATVVKDVVVDDLDDGYQDITTITVTNDSPRSMLLTGKQVIIGKPSEWKYGTFNSQRRSNPYVISDTNTADNTINLDPGASATFQVVLQPFGIAGDGRVEVQFSDLNDPRQLLGKAIVTSEIVKRSASTSGIHGSNVSGGNDDARPTPTSVRLFPNPTQESRFFVEAPPGTKLGRIEVSNTLGNRLRKFDRPDGKNGYDVEGLPDGLYLISIYDDKGKKLKTLRLLHRQYGA